MAQRIPNFRGHVVLGGVLECLTGLHVGGNRDSLVLGGLDLPVARDPATRLPIIPGSTLKGRLRALLEMLRGTGAARATGAAATAGSDVAAGAAPTAEGEDGGGEKQRDSGALLFGTRGGTPARLVVRDALPLDSHTRARRPDENTVNWWQLLETDGLGTEVKAETAINRVTAAVTPRQVERVIAGSRFQLEFVLNVFDEEQDEERLLKDLLVALALLEDSYLGGHGSRGYGRVRVLLHERPAVVSRQDYERGRKRALPAGELKPLDELDHEALLQHVRERLNA